MQNHSDRFGKQEKRYKCRLGGEAGETHRRQPMSRKTQTIIPLAAALAALGASGAPAEVNAAVPEGTVVRTTAVLKPTGQPNLFYTIGDDLLSFTVTQNADGTMVAQHYSHSSHSSHASHASHASSRY